MTWPFENNTTTMIKKYAKKSIKAGQTKSLLSILTILLSTALLFGFVLSVIGMETQTKRELQVIRHALYSNLDANQIQALKQDQRLSGTLLLMQGSNTIIENYMVAPVYFEQNDSPIVMMKLVEGQYPKELYEVAVDKAYLKQLGLPEKLGVQFTIHFYDGTVETFTVVGLTDTEATERVYSLYCSKQYAKYGSQFQNAVTALAVQLTSTNQMSVETFIDTVREIGADYKISEKYLEYNETFAASLQPDSEDIGIIIIFSIAVIFVSYLVIYSIFYIYVQNQIREFGQLRTMGATSKQIKKILRAQGRRLCSYGTFFGLPIGGIVAFLFKPNGWSWINTAIASFLIVCLIYGMTWIAMRKPAKIAGSVSPVEAMKSTGYQSPQKSSQRLHRKITPFSLAVMGSSRNRRKWIVTVLSLGVAGIMFMGSTTLLASLDWERFVRHGLLEYGEFYLDLSANAKRKETYGQTGIQLKNPFNDKLLQTITQIKGVREITVYQTLEAQFEYNGITDKNNLTPFLPEQQSLLEQYLIAGTIDYEAMTENNEILILRNEFAEYNYGWKFQIGDTVRIRWYNGKEYQENEYKIAGEISNEIFKNLEGGRIFGKTGFFLLPEKLLQKMMPIGFNFNSHILVSIEKLSQEPAIRQEMIELVLNTPMVTMKTLYDFYQDSKVMYRRTSAVIWGLSGFTMLFAVINLINTLIATILSRKHEFSVLRAVGMGQKQLQRTIQYEGILLSLWNICITLTIGSTVGYAIVRYLNHLGDDTWVWNFPLLYFIYYVIISIFLPIVISAIIIHLLQKKTVVEQLREFEIS